MVEPPKNLILLEEFPSKESGQTLADTE